MRRIVPLLLLLPSLLAAQTITTMPYGMNAWTDLDEWCGNPKPFPSTYAPVEPSKVLIVLQKGYKCGVGLHIVYPRRLYTKDGTNCGFYSGTKNRALSDQYAAIPADSIKKYRDARILLGFVTGDDYGSPDCWGGIPIPITEARDAANYAKQKMPYAPIGIRLDALRMEDGAPTGWKIDYAIAQWIASPGMLRRWGTPQNWFKLNAEAANRLGLVGMYYNINTYHCTGSSVTPPCTPTQVTNYGGAAVNQPKSCGFISWRWEPSIWNGAYRTAWEAQFAKAKTKPYLRCYR